jgi:hypothetical protein
MESGEFSESSQKRAVSVAPRPWIYAPPCASVLINVYRSYFKTWPCAAFADDGESILLNCGSRHVDPDQENPQQYDSTQSCVCRWF